MWLLNSKKFFIIILGMVLAITVHANDYVSGHQALQVWDADAQENLPQWIKIWLLSMMLVFAAGLLFVWRHVEARWLVAGVVLGLLFSKFALPVLGWVPLSGLVALIHLVFWSPALYMMLKNRPFMKELSPYAVWSGLATACIIFSFIFDVRDSIKYLMYCFS